MWVLLYNVNTHEPFKKIKIWGRVYLINIQNSEIFYEIFSCAMNRFKNVSLGVFKQNQNTKTIFKKIWDKTVPRNFQNSENFIVKQEKNEWRTA